MIFVFWPSGDCLGTSVSPNMDVFFGKLPKGGGGAFPVQKFTLQILLVSKRYILVVNFWKNGRKEERGGHLQSKKFHCKFTQVNVYLRKKHNEISKSYKHPNFSRRSPLRMGWPIVNTYLVVCLSVTRKIWVKRRVSLTLFHLFTFR